MKNILILADGSIAKSFIEWINKTRIAENSYHVACYKGGVLPEKLKNVITMCHIDPTSYSKLLNLMSEKIFAMVFVIMEEKDDVVYTLKNIRQIDEKIRIVLLDKWDDNYKGIDNLKIVNEHKLVASHLYDNLPNVPVIAQNVGLGEGEIMEMLVPFGSNYAYRHVGSIAQRKWKIAALYRKKKQIIPTSATMIYPNDTLLVLGKPMVLDGVYKSINKRIGLFPEPFGKNIYLILDLIQDEKKALVYLQESIYFTEKLENKKLFIRIINPTNFLLIESLKLEEKSNISVHVCYDSKEMHELIEYDIQTFDIGLVFNSIDTFEKLELATKFFQLRKLVYLFGDKTLYDINKSVLLMTNQSEMESISSAAIDFSESLGLELHLCDFDPEGEFEDTKIIIEHYETLSQIFNYKVHIEQETANPVRAVRKMQSVVQVAAYGQDMKSKSTFNLISTRVQDYILSSNKHPKILVPSELSGS